MCKVWVPKTSDVKKQQVGEWAVGKVASDVVMEGNDEAKGLERALRRR